MKLLKIISMEFIETYKGLNIYKVNGLFQVGLNSGSVSDINFLKRLINIKIKHVKQL
jgi:hypothetical protein